MMQIPLALLGIPLRRVEKIAGLALLVGAALALALNQKSFAAKSDAAAAETDAASAKSGAVAGSPAHAYSLAAVHRVNGRQGVCVEGGFYWVSGSTTLTKYDENWNVVAENTDPFKGFELEVNHIGDIDVYQNELYLGVEHFMDGVGKNIQIAVYDGDTLERKRVFPFRGHRGGPRFPHRVYGVLD